MGDYLFRNHIVPQAKLHYEGRCSDTSEFFDVYRQRKTSIDALQEATIDDYRKIDGDKSPSEPWIGVT